MVVSDSGVKKCMQYMSWNTGGIIRFGVWASFVAFPQGGARSDA